MQEKFPSFILIAAGLLDLSGASRNEHHVSEVLGLSLPGEAQPRAESSPVPSKVFSITEDNSDEVTFNFRSPGVDSTNEMTADFIPVHTETAAKRTAVLPKELVRDLEVPEQLHTEAPALKLQDGHTSPSKSLSSISSPVSTDGSQTTTRPEQPDSSLQEKPENTTEAGFSPVSSSSGLPQPILSGGTQQDSPVFSIPVSKQMEMPSPKTSLLTSTVNFHPPGKEIAASPFPTRINIAFESARVDCLPRGAPPTSKRPEDTHPRVQPDRKAGVTPIYLKKTQNMDAKVTTSAFLQKPASGDLDVVYSRMTHTTTIQFSPVLSLKQETTGSKARNSPTAVINGSGHQTQFPALQTHPQGNAHSSSLLMHLEALGHDDLLPSPFQGPISTADRKQPLSLSQTLNCTKQHVSQETNRSSQDITVLVLQRDTNPQAMTSKPEKPRSPGSSQSSANSSSLSQSWISTLKLSQTTKELKGVTSAFFPSTSTFENAALQPVSTFDSVHGGLQPPDRSFPTYVGLQLMGIPTSAEKGLHIPTSSTSTGSGSQVQGISSPSVSQEVFPVMLQASTVEDSQRKKSLPQQIDKTVSPPLTPQATPVPSPSGLHDNGNQKVPLHSFAPSASQIQQAGSLVAFASELPSLHAQGIQSSSTTAHPEPVVPGVSDEIPAYLAQALVQQFGISRDVATKNLSAFRAGQLTSSPYLSFLLKNANGMICLQPMQDSPLPTKFPNASVGGLISIQQILVASNSSVLDLANLKNLSPSSLILVKPVFILLPTDRPDLQMVPSPEGEDDHKGAAFFTNKQDRNLSTPESSHDIPMKTSFSYPTSKSLRPETTLSTASNQQGEITKVTSQPVLTNPNYTAMASLFQAVTSASNHLLDPVVRISTTVQAMHLHMLPEEMQVPAPNSQEAKGSDLLLLNGTLMPFTSPVPLVMSAQHSPRISPKVLFTAVKPQSSVIPLLSAKGLPDFQMPAQPLFAVTGSVDEFQHSKELMLQTTGRHQGLASTPSSVHAQCTECLTSHSAGAINYPLKLFTSIMPLQSTSQSLLSTESLRRLPSQVQFVPSTSSAFSTLPAGSDGKDSAAGSTTCSGGVTVCAKAAQTLTTSVRHDLTKLLEFTPIVPKPLTMTERPTIAPAHTPFSTKVQMKTAVPGELLAAITHPRVYTSSPASPPSPVSTHVPLLSAMKRDQIHQTPTKLFSEANMGENTKPTEISTSSRKIGTGKILGTSMSLSATFNTRTPQPLGNKVVLTPVQPSVSAETTIALEIQPKLIQITPQSSLAMTSLSTAKNDYITTSLTSKKAFLLPTSTVRSDPSTVLPTIARVNKSAVVSASTEKSEDMLVKRDAATASQLPTQAPMYSSYQPSAQRPLEKVPLEDNTEHETGHSRSGTITHAAGPSTSEAFSVSANRLVNKVTNQSAVLNTVAVNDAEMLLARDLIQSLPSPQSPSYFSQSLIALKPHGNSLLGVASTGQSERLFLNTEAEEMVRTDKVTEEAAEGLVTVLTLLDSEPSALLSESHQRRVLQSDATILNGLAVVSDDVCGSGNYTVQMSLRPAAEAGPVAERSTPSQETFLALIAVQSNSSQPVLQVRSCCVTPSASPGGPGAMCCLFHRLSFECRHIQLLQTSKSREASFTIQLFQMLNHSVAYLHCELNVCLRDKTGCEQDCFESVEPLLQPSDRNSYGNLHNLISFGPVFRMKNKFLYKPVESLDSAMLVPILLGSLTGFAVLGTAFTSLWLHHRQKTKTTCYPQLGEIHGL